MSISGSGVEDGNPVIIKKYANRRLYDTERSAYITLDHLSTMTRAGREFKVIDAKTGDDITHSVLTQIIMEEETHGTTLLPVSFLRQLIALYGDQMQAMVPHYLEASMSLFRRNQEQMRAAVQNMMPGGAESGFEALARQNMAMMKAAAEMWAKATPMAGTRNPGADAPAAPPPAGDVEGPVADDLRQLKEQIDALQARIERLAGE
jgi:polyhydroxyalkanoate synthesis repressor PhaR